VTATLPVDTPALRERALKNLEEVRAVMKQRGIGMVVLREPKGGREQVVTMTELMTRANAERAAVSPLPLPPSTPLTPAEIGVDPRTGVMTIKLRPAHDRFSVLEQAMREAPTGVTRIEIAGDEVTLALDHPHFAARYSTELGRIRRELARHDNRIHTIVLQDTRFPGSIQTITKDGIKTEPVQYPSVPNVRPEPHHSWPNGWVLEVPVGGFSIAETIRELGDKYGNLAGKTIILDSYRIPNARHGAGTRVHFFDLLYDKSPFGDWARRELEQLRQVAEDLNVTIVIDPSRMGQFQAVPGIGPRTLKNQLVYEMLPVPRAVPRTR
jgi:hypothetical protein